MTILLDTQCTTHVYLSIKLLHWGLLHNTSVSQSLTVLQIYDQPSSDWGPLLSVWGCGLRTGSWAATLTWFIRVSTIKESTGRYQADSSSQTSCINTGTIWGDKKKHFIKCQTRQPEIACQLYSMYRLNTIFGVYIKGLDPTAKTHRINIILSFGSMLVYAVMFNHHDDRKNRDGLRLSWHAEPFILTSG